jgi:hypothetical protein
MRRSSICAVLTWSAAALAQPWANGFEHRQRIEVVSMQSATVFQVEATIDTSLTMSADCADVRVTASDGVSEVPFWIESGCRTPQTRLWFRASSLVAGTTTLFAYSRRRNTPNAADPRAVFFAFDDFSTDPTARWSSIRCTPMQDTFLWSAARTLVLTAARNTTSCAATLTTIDPSWETSFAIEFRFRISGFGGIGSGNPSFLGGDGLALAFFSGGPNARPPFAEVFGLDSDGYTVRFDTYLNQHPATPIFDDVHNFVGFVERVDGGYTSLSRTGGSQAYLRDGAWHAARLSIVGATGRVDIDGNTVVLTNKTWRLDNRHIAFGAATGDAVAQHEIDDVRVRRVFAQTPLVFVLPLEQRPTLQSDAGPDGGIDAAVLFDAGADAGRDGGLDAGRIGTDAGTDAGADAGDDAGSPGMIDAGTDSKKLVEPPTSLGPASTYRVSCDAGGPGDVWWPWGAVFLMRLVRRRWG